MAFLAFLAGLILLAAGAESLVRGASSLARRMGISTLLVGLTIVAWGTSAPELGASIQAALQGQSPMAMGNVLGSNIFNVLVILGLCALVMPLSVSVRVIRFDIPIMIAASVAVVVMASDGLIGPREGILLLAGLVAYFVAQGMVARSDAVREASAAPRTHVWADVVLVVAGLIVLFLGARLLVAGAVALGRWAGIGGEVIGLTIIAAGTSLPEVATSIAAILRGERDLAIGNVVGSNIFNLLGVLGVCALVVPGSFVFDAVGNLPDMAIMLAVAVMCLPICISGLEVSRQEGAVMMAAYGVYLALVVLRAMDPSTSAAVNGLLLAGAVILPAAAMLMLVAGKRS